MHLSKCPNFSCMAEPTRFDLASGQLFVANDWRSFADQHIWTGPGRRVETEEPYQCRHRSLAWRRDQAQSPTAAPTQLMLMAVAAENSTVLTARVLNLAHTCMAENWLIRREAHGSIELRLPSRLTRQTSPTHHTFFNATAPSVTIAEGFFAIACGGTYILVRDVKSVTSFRGPERHNPQMCLIGSRDALRAGLD